MMMAGLELGRGGARLALLDSRTRQVLQATYLADPPLSALRGAHQVVVCHRDLPILSRYTEVPALSGTALENAIQSRLHKYFPYDPALHHLTSINCPTLSGNHKALGYTLYVYAKEMLTGCQQSLQGLNCETHIDLRGLAIARYLLHQESSSHQGRQLFVAALGDSLTAGLLADGRVYWACDLPPHNGQDFTGRLLGLESYVEQRLVGVPFQLGTAYLLGDIEVDAGKFRDLAIQPVRLIAVPDGGNPVDFVVPIGLAMREVQ